MLGATGLVRPFSYAGLDRQGRPIPYGLDATDLPLSALGDPAYSAAKAGLISLTKALALEYGRFGIRANIILPGTVRTPIWEERTARNPEILKDLSGPIEVY